MVNGLAPDTFSIVSFRGREAMSSAYSFRIVAAATVDGDEIEQRALGQSAILMWTVGSSIRAFYGVIASLRVGASLDAGRAACQVHFVPRLWLLKRKRRTRIFQKMRVLDVVTSVLLEAGIAARWQLSKVYPVRDYCTQYEETDYAFVTRLLAEASQQRERRIGHRRCVLLEIHVDRHTGVLDQHLLQRRHAHVRERTVAPREHAPHVPGREIRQRRLGDRARHSCHAPPVRIMRDHHVAVRAEVRVGLERVRPELERPREREQRVLRSLDGRPAMGVQKRL